MRRGRGPVVVSARRQRPSAGTISIGGTCMRDADAAAGRSSRCDTIFPGSMIRVSLGAQFVRLMF